MYYIYIFDTCILCTYVNKYSAAHQKADACISDPILNLNLLPKDSLGH